jgi:hypothetical protein
MTTTYARAVAGYDAEFRRRLTEAILTTIARESMITVVNVMAIRSGETVDALVDVLIITMAMMPCFDVASKLRKACETLCKRVRVEVARARAEGVADDLGASGKVGRA